MSRFSNSISNEDIDESDGIYDLVICREYVECLFDFKFDDLKYHRQRILCLKSATTSHDLTGQIIWPACILMSWFLLADAFAKIEGLDGYLEMTWKETIVIELGAGCGLSGFVAAHHSHNVVITDGNDEVVSLLDRNRELLAMSNVVTRKLLWGKKSEVDDLLNSFAEEQKDLLVIGADVLLWPNQVLSLLFSIFLLLAGSRNPNVSRCVISYVERATSTTAIFRALAANMRIIIEEVPFDFLPVRRFPQEIGLGSTLAGKHILKLSLDMRQLGEPRTGEATIAQQILQRLHHLYPELAQQLRDVEAGIENSFLPC